MNYNKLDENYEQLQCKPREGKNKERESMEGIVRRKEEE